MILPGSDLMPVIRGALERGQRVRMTVNGSSMLPFIYNDDTVEIESSHTPPRVGDILLVQKPGGCYVLHRVVRVKGESFFVRGDAQTCSEGPLAHKNILGKVILSERGGRIRNHAHGAWHVLGRVWVFAYPVGVHLLQCYLKLRGAGGKVLRQLGIYPKNRAN